MRGIGVGEFGIFKVHSIDPVSVRKLVEEILEGSKDAFDARRFRYGF